MLPIHQIDSHSFTNISRRILVDTDYLSHVRSPKNTCTTYHSVNISDFLRYMLYILKTTSNVIHPTPRIIHYISLVRHHTSYITHHTSNIIFNTINIMQRTAYGTLHTSCTIHHAARSMYHASYVIQNSS